MSALTRIVTGAAGLAAVVGFASPAAAQYYPNYGYGNSVGNVIGEIVGALGGVQYGGYGYNGYGNNTQQAVQQCAAAVEQRINGNYGGGYGGYGYNQGYGYGGGYGYNQGYGRGRVLSITHADRHGGGITKVKGYATSGANAGYGGGYGASGSPDLYFKCEVDYRGYIRDLDINRNSNYGYNNYGYRGY